MNSIGEQRLQSNHILRIRVTNETVDGKATKVTLDYTMDVSRLSIGDDNKSDNRYGSPRVLLPSAIMYIEELSYNYHFNYVHYSVIGNVVVALVCSLACFLIHRYIIT